jgi:hypothetical protein
MARVQAHMRRARWRAYSRVYRRAHWLAGTLSGALLAGSLTYLRIFDATETIFNSKADGIIHIR